MPMLDWLGSFSWRS